MHVYLSVQKTYLYQWIFIWHKRFTATLPIVIWIVKRGSYQWYKFQSKVFARSRTATILHSWTHMALNGWKIEDSNVQWWKSQLWTVECIGTQLRGTQFEGSGPATAVHIEARFFGQQRFKVFRFAWYSILENGRWKWSGDPALGNGHGLIQWNGYGHTVKYGFWAEPKNNDFIFTDHHGIHIIGNKNGYDQWHGSGWWIWIRMMDMDTDDGYGYKHGFQDMKWK